MNDIEMGVAEQMAKRLEDRKSSEADLNLPEPP
jgi:hypothetical protein